ncbi:MAG: DUF4190 domain-containing protein [Clostridia bacterium]|nr:DUF4190 domain-containing protein [Clostridia bacterium]
MKQCPKCNFSNQDFDAVCANCGSPLNYVNDPGPYGTPGAGMYNQGMPVKTNGFAITSMVLGIVAIPLICCCYIGVIPAILAVIFGFIARSKIRSSVNIEKGDGMALAGIIMGFSVIGIIFILIMLQLSGAFSFNYYWEDFQRQLEENMNNR